MLLFDIYPQSPQPNEAVNSIEKATRITIHISSFFMIISPLIVGSGSCLFDYDHGFLFSTFDLGFIGGGHFRLETQGPHHYYTKYPPCDLP